MPSRRLERVAAQIVREVGAILARHVSDPELGFVTVRHASVSPDLEVATVFVSVLGDAERVRSSIQALERARGLVRQELGRRLRLRVTPDVRFQLDPEGITEERLRQLLGDTASPDIDAGPDSPGA